MEETDQGMAFSSPEDMIEVGTEYLSSMEPDKILKARQIFEHLLNTLDRTNAGIIFSLGVTYMREARYGLAEALFKYGVSLTEDPESIGAIENNLGFIYNIEGRREEAKAAFEKAIAVDGTQAEYFNNVATLYVNTAEPRTALEWIDKALAIDPENHDAHWNRGLSNLELGNWEEGWAGYAHGLLGDVAHSSQKRKQRYAERPEVDYWKGEDDGVIAVYGEQGVGDEILAASVLEEIAEKHAIVFECHPRLVSIFRHSFPQFPIYGTRKVVSDQVANLALHEIKYKAPIFNLCQSNRLKDEDFPRVAYLKPFEEEAERMRQWLSTLSSGRPRIGISWKGGSVMTRNDLRSIPLMEWKSLFEAVDAEWVSLQYDPADNMGWNTAIAAQFVKETGIELNHDQVIVNDLDLCYGGLIHALDLVISINTSLVHACGAYGVQCWTLTPNMPAWRYNLPGETGFRDDQMVWYGDWVRQIRQEPGTESWAEVLEQVTEELVETYGKRKAS